MKNAELLSFPTQNVPFTASAARAAGDLVKEGNRYGRVVDTAASGDVGMLSVRGIFAMEKATGADTWADGALVEAVVAEGGAFTVQEKDQGPAIGKAWGATLTSDTEANVELLPELS
jgi:predicted RecA/RadA family phage recombinase